MGERLGEVCFLLWKELLHLHNKWNEFKVLFASEGVNIEVMNRIAPHFFGHVQTIWWSDMLLHIARLTDPPGGGSKQNLSLQLLPSLIEHPELREEVAGLVAESVAKTLFIREWRNCALAHNDLKHALGPTTSSLASTEYDDIENALTALRGPINAIEVYFERGAEPYEQVVPGLQGAGAFRLYLQRRHRLSA
jgi:hypothetical protein